MCVSLLLGYLLIMEVFSLEDDGFSNLFLTQESRNSAVLHNGSGCTAVLPDPMDFSSPCVTLTPGSNDSTGCVYEDISDSENFQIPSSQEAKQSVRFVVLAV